MAATDLLLKKLFNTFPQDYAALLLKTEVEAVRSCATELPPPSETLKADLVFEVTKATGQKVILHLEFQARSSHRPMPQRQLAYLTRLTEEHKLPIRSIVLYVGEGAGRGDTGQHSYLGDDDQPILSWCYDVIHLWQIDAEEIIALGRPGLLPLVGQAKLTEPTTTLPKVLAQLREVDDLAQRSNLLELFVSLMADKELITMVRKSILEDELLVDTPYMEWLQELRLEGLQEGLEKGRQEGHQEGHQEGRQEGIQNSILDTLEFRFGLTQTAANQIKVKLALVANAEQLHTLFLTALRAETLGAFQVVLAQHQSQPQN